MIRRAILILLLLLAASSIGSAENIVFGFWPDYINNSVGGNVEGYQPDWNNLTHVAFSDIKINTDGSLDTSEFHEDVYANVTAQANSSGAKLIITVVPASNTYACYNGSLNINRALAIANIVNFTETHNADGVCVDYEAFDWDTITLSGAVNWTPRVETFIGDLNTSLKNSNPSSEISVCTIYSIFDVYKNASTVSNLNNIIIMGYDYKNTGSSTAGINSPPGSLLDAVDELDIYAPIEKIVMGLPLYGYEWPVINNSYQATTNGTGSTRTLFEMFDWRPNATVYRDEPSMGTPWYTWQNDSGQWYQGWYDDNVSLRNKASLLHTQKNITGIAFWGLGFEGSNSDILANTVSILSNTSVSVVAHRNSTTTSIDSGEEIPISVLPVSTIESSITGSVPDYHVIDEANLSTMPDYQHLVDFWNFNGDANGLRGTAGTATNVVYHDSDTAYFNGASSRITMAGNAKLDLVSNMSIVFMLSNHTPATGYIIAKKNSTDPSGYNIRSSSGWYMVISNGSSGLITSTLPLTGHIAAMTNILTTTASPYKNGVAYPTMNLVGPFSHTTAPVTVGARTGSSTYALKGNLDYIGIYNISQPISTSRAFYAGGTGVSFRPDDGYNFTGYSGAGTSVVPTANTNNLEVVNSAGTTLSSITLTENITDSAIVSSDSVIGNSRTVVLQFTPSYNYTTVEIPYTIPAGYADNNATLTTNDVSAIVSVLDGIVTISSSDVNVGDTMQYSLTFGGIEPGIHEGYLMMWTGTSWSFANITPTNNSAWIGDQLEVTVS